MLLKSTLEKKNSVVLNDVQFLLLPCTIYIAPADLVTSKFSTSHTYNSTSHTYNIHITRRISPCAMYIVRVGCKKCTCHQMYVLQDFLFFSEGRGDGFREIFALRNLWAAPYRLARG